MQRQGGQQLGPRGGREAIPYMGRGSPFTLMRRMVEDMDRMFEDFGLGRMLATQDPSSMLGRGWGGAWNPEIEVARREGELVVTADLPGLKKDDINIQIDEGSLVITGERREEKQEQRGDVSYSERSYGSFSRAIPIPRGVGADEVDASFRDGVLEVHVKLPETTAGGRRVEIKSGEEKKGASEGSQPSGGR